jgi:hypothetical protein
MVPATDANCRFVSPTERIRGSFTDRRKSINLYLFLGIEMPAHKFAKRITLIPAYGRDYKSKAALVKDFNDNKDFIIMDMSSQWDTKPANKEDLKNHGYTVASIRYKQQRETAVVNIK